jgi:hypothetical protein
LSSFALAGSFASLSSLTIDVPALNSIDLSSLSAPLLTALSVSGCLALRSVSLPPPGNISSLNFQSTNITTLDVRGFSKLTQLNLYQMPVMDSLTVVDSALRSLQSLGSASWHPSLKSFTVADSPLLTSLSASGHSQLSAVNARNLTGLLSLSLSTLPALTSVDFALLNAMRLTSLIASSNAALRTLGMPLASIALASIDVDGTNLTTLDLRGFSKLSSLSFYQLPSLATLTVGESALRSLQTLGSASWHPSLKSFTVADSPLLTSLSASDHAHVTSVTVRNLTGLLSLTVSALPALTSLDFAMLGAPRLTSLTASDNTALSSLILPKEPSALASINVDGSGFVDLEGLSASFHPNLTSLSVASTANMKSLDVRGFTKLSSLGLYQMPSLTSLTIVDSALRSLQSPGSASWHPALKSFSVADSPLLTSLSATGHAQLSNVTVRNLTGLLSLSLSSLPALNSLDLALLSATRLTTLSLGANVALRTLVLPLASTSLSFLDVDDSNITTLDVRGFSKLSTLTTYRVRSLTSLTVGESALQSLRSLGSDSWHPVLKSLSVADSPLLTSLSATGHALLSNVTARNLTGLLSLSLSSLPALNSLDLALLSASRLTTLTLGANVALRTLGMPLASTALASIDLGGTGIINVDVRGFPKLSSLDFYQMSSLTSLTIGESSLRSLQSLGSASWHPALRQLTVANSPLLTSLVATGHALMSNLTVRNLTSLTSLVVSRNQIRVADIADLPLVTNLDITLNNLNGKLFALPPLARGSNCKIQLQADSNCFNDLANCGDCVCAPCTRAAIDIDVNVVRGLVQFRGDRVCSNCTLWCLVDGRVSVRAVATNATDSQCALPVLAAGWHSVSVGDAIAGVEAMRFIAHTSFLVESGAQLAWPSSSDFRVGARVALPSALSGLSLLWRLVVAIGGDVSALVMTDARAFSSMIDDAAAAQAIASVVGANVTATIVALELADTNRFNVAPWLPVAIGCYGRYCGASSCAASSAPPIDAIDAVCLEARMTDTGELNPKLLAAVSRAVCTTLECDRYRRDTMQRMLLVGNGTALPPLLRSRVDMAALAVYETLLSLTTKRSRQTILLPAVRALPPAEAAAIAKFAIDLERVESGDLVPDASSRLGAYLATRGYPPGSVGEAVHRAIAAIYLTLGPLGEEQIGNVFNSAEARALYNDPIDGPSGRKIAQIEFSYWDSVRMRNPLSVGAQLAVLFDVDTRVWLQERFSSLPSFAAVQKVVRTIRQSLVAALSWLVRKYRALVSRVSGDPHLVSLDGRGFSFQGRGDFVLSRAYDPDGFALHARFETQKSFSRATLTAALAVRASRFVPTVHIWSTARGVLRVAVGARELGLPIASYLIAGGLTLSSDLPSRTVDVQFDNGIAVRAVAWLGGAANNESLIWHVSLSLPVEFAGAVDGLLGNANGDASDDAGGSGDLWTWGMSWALTAEDSLLPGGVVPSSDVWMPPTSAAVLANATSAQRAAATAACAAVAGLAGAPDLNADCIVDHVLSEGAMQTVADYAASVAEKARVELLSNLTLARENDTSVAIRFRTSNITLPCTIEFRTDADAVWQGVAVVNGSTDVSASLLINPATTAVVWVRVSIAAADGAVSDAQLSAQLAITRGMTCEPFCPPGYCGDDNCGGVCVGDCSQDSGTTLLATATPSTMATALETDMSSTVTETNSDTVSPTGETDSLSTTLVVSHASKLAASRLLALHGIFIGLLALL